MLFQLLCGCDDAESAALVEQCLNVCFVCLERHAPCARECGVVRTCCVCWVEDRTGAWDLCACGVWE